MPTLASRKVVKRESVKIRKQTRRGRVFVVGGASSLLNAVTSENTGQAMRLRSMGDAWNVVMVNEEVRWKLDICKSPALSSSRA
jgi:hypothetical protein